MEWLKVKWCEWFHRGGSVLRDPQGRINWRCASCGRWSGYPVPLDEERRATDRALEEYRARQRPPAPTTGDTP